MKTRELLMLASVFALLALDWLTFHDLREAHTMRDYLALFSSILVFLYFVMDLSSKKRK